ncbi:MAG TPA: ATP-binding protein [Labilithrix sp.]|nr:ATP-binding protein [Labilithrix sp.]
MRVRAIFIAAISFAIWAQQFLLYENEIFASRTHSRVYRSIEAIACVGLVLYLLRKRPVKEVEWAVTGAFSVLAVAHAFAIVVVNEPCVIPFTLTAEWAQMVIVLVTTLSFRPTLFLLTVTWASGALATTIRAKWDIDLSDHLVLFGIYALVLMSVRGFDGLRRNEFTARVRLGEALARLKRSEEVRGRLFVNLSHDFRTPLSLIHAEAELLDRNPTPEARTEAIGRVRTHAMFLADLTNQLLELARLEAGKTPLHASNFDVRRVAEEVATQFASAEARRTIRVLAREGGSVPLGVSADEGHVRRILSNLVSNAVRSLPEGGEVRIDVAMEAEGVTIDVIDDGPGIEPSRREAIFERFASFAGAGSVASGIGLPVARELAELNGGSLVLVESAEKTTFRVRLPRATTALEETARTRLSTPPALPFATKYIEVRQGRSPARSLVIVEDHPEMRRLLSELLGDRFDIELATSSAEAKALLAKMRPRAILCDILLPDGSGYDVLEWVRTQRSLDGVPVLFLSALGTAEQRVRGVAAGAVDYVTKPFATDELIARLESACTHAEERAGALEALRQDMLAELHDGVTSSLSRASLLLGSAAGREATRLAEIVTHAREAVDDGLSEARSILLLSGGHLTQWEVLVDALESEVRAIAKAFSTTVTLDVDNDESAPSLSNVEAHTIRRLVREALTNAVKHGRGSIGCTFAVRAGEALLEIENEHQPPDVRARERPALPGTRTRHRRAARQEPRGHAERRHVRRPYDRPREASLAVRTLVLTGAGADELLGLVKPGGRVAYPNGVEPAPRSRYGLTVESFDGYHGRDAFERLNRLIAMGPFQVEVSRAYTLEETPKALADVTLDVLDIPVSPPLAARVRFLRERLIVEEATDEQT